MYGGGNPLEGMIAGMLSKQGCDPAMMAALMKDKDGFGQGGIWIILVLLLVLGRGRGGLFGGDDCGDGGRHGDHWGQHAEFRHTDDLIVNETNYKSLLEAIAGNREGLEALARELGVESRVLDNHICEVKGLIRETNGDVEAAIARCCCETQKMIERCCCDTNRHLDKVDCDIKTSKLETDFLIEKKFCEVNAHIAKCCCDQAALVDKKFCEQNMYLERQFCDIKTREDGREIDRLRAELARRDAREHDDFIVRAIREDAREARKRAAWERCHCQCAPITATTPAVSDE